MIHSRRSARELALKALYQADVGKQPLQEALEGALDQIRTSAMLPVNQAEKEAVKELRALPLPDADRASAQSVGQLKAATTAAIGELRSLTEQLAQVLRQTLSAAPEYTLASAELRAREIAAQTASNLDRIGRRASLYPKFLPNMACIASESAVELANLFLERLPEAEPASGFLVLVATGAFEQRSEIDKRVGTLSKSWALDRLAAVDRNILRLAAYELLYLPDVPPAVTAVDEAVDLAKKFSTAESGRYVNGILGALAGQGDGVTR